jgi:hypothetical protein
MIKIFIAPQSGEQTTPKYSKTENGGYKVSDLEQILGVVDYQKLKFFSEIFFWGNKPNSKSKWEKIEIGDYILFYAKRKIVAYSKIIYKTQNPKLAEEIWGWTKTEKGEDVLWEYLYFFEKPIPTEIPFKELIEFADYAENYVIQGFTPYSIKGSEKINTKFGDIQKYLESFKNQKNESIITFDFSSSGLNLNNSIITRFTSSLLTKPFVILTGLSGSGKTKLAQAFALWMSANKEQYALVPVGADWTNREPLLGYPNSLKGNHYVKPDTGVLDILLRAHENYMVNEKDLVKCTPYFLILDEMNLSHVERYFADFLSTMESGDEIKLYSGSDRFAELDAYDQPIINSKIPNKIILPKNLFIIGTVNIDETTYMFSPKVLDRANTIEFRITPEEMEAFYQNSKPLKMDALLAQGKDQAPDFMALAAGNKLKMNRSKHKDTFVAFFETLQVAGAEFGYRTATEMTKLVSYLMHFGMSETEAYDVAIMQKLLPKLHGSRSKLNKVLPILISLCNHKYPISLEKLERMKKNAEDNGFASYAEA